jgi:hypothetical protein
MAWPPDNAVSRRDDALHRTRRISLGTAAGALAATGVLGFAFARALPGRSAALATVGHTSGQAPPGAGASTSAGSPGASAHPASSHRHRRHTQASSQPAPAPVPAYTPPQVVSGGS